MPVVAKCVAGRGAGSELGRERWCVSVSTLASCAFKAGKQAVVVEIDCCQY